MRSKLIWTSLVIILLAAAGFIFRDNIFAGAGGQPETEEEAAANQTETAVAIRPATDVAQVSAAGNIELADPRSVVFQVEGIITQVAVEVGDEVATGDLLVALDTLDLERAVEQAQLNVSIQQAQLDALHEPADPAEIAAARADLASAQAGLEELQAGPSQAELAAAQAALASAQAGYQELLDGSSQAELTQLGAEMHKAYIALQQAQEAYNEIAYRDSIGSSQQAMDLQEATIDYDVAKAAYEVATEAASDSEVQDALRAIEEARVQLNELTPTGTELASARAQVANAQASLSDLLAGPTEAELIEAELALEQAQIDLEEAEVNLSRARLRAPVGGTVLGLEVDVGQRATNGSNAVTVADLSALELTVNVAEVDISKVQVDQPAQIALDAFPDRSFSGRVDRIAPTSESDSGVVNYAVTIRLDDLDLGGVRPGMTAVATLLDDTSGQQWLVPTSALREFEGETTVMVVRDQQRTRIPVTPGTSQGEWTVVQSPELKTGDKVMGRVASYLDEESGPGRGGPFGGGPPRN